MACVDGSLPGQLEATGIGVAAGDELGVLRERRVDRLLVHLGPAAHADDGIADPAARRLPEPPAGGLGDERAEADCRSRPRKLTPCHAADSGRFVDFHGDLRSYCFSSFSNLGWPFSGAKFGSIDSQPGDR